MAISLPDDFKEFLRLCHAHGVEYLVVGGYAVGHYGYPRATADLDVWVGSTRSNAERCVAVLNDFGFTDSGLSADAFQDPRTLIRFGVPPLRLELLVSVSGLEFAECYARRLEVIWSEVPVHVVSLPDLKINKQASGRAKDFNDLEHLPE